MSKVYDAEERLMQPMTNPERDELVLSACRAMMELCDCGEASADDRRLAIETVEKVNRRLDHRWIEAQKNATERLKIKASVAADTARSWQPNGTRPSNFDPELQAIIDVGGIEDDDTGQPDSDE